MERKISVAEVFAHTQNIRRRAACFHDPALLLLCYSLASAIAEQARCRPCSCDVCFLIWEIELYVNAADIQEPIRSVVLHDGFAIDLKIRTTSCKNARYPQAQDS